LNRALALRSTSLFHAPRCAERLTEERQETMSILGTLRKGFGYLLMAFGVSNTPRKTRPAHKIAAKIEPDKS
jgi:hypothetical protein